MPIPVICPCAAKLRVGDHLLGKRIQCPKCGEVHPVGSSGAAPMPGALGGSPTTEAALSDSMLSDDEKRRAEGELRDGERIIWAGRPETRMAFVRGWLIAAAIGSFAIVPIVAGIIVGVVAKKMEGAALYAVIGTSVGAVLIIGAAIAAPFYQRWRWGRRFYTLTNKRATVWAVNFFGGVEPVHYEPTEMHNLRFIPSPRYGEDAGEVVFRSKTISVKSSDGRGPTSDFTINYGFLALRNGRHVEKLIRETLVDPLLSQLTA